MCCPICNEPFEKGDIKCRDHDNRTAMYRGAAHQRCTLKLVCVIGIYQLCCIIADIKLVIFIIKNIPLKSTAESGTGGYMVF